MTSFSLYSIFKSVEQYMVWASKYLPYFFGVRVCVSFWEGEQSERVDEKKGWHQGLPASAPGYGDPSFAQPEKYSCYVMLSTW